MSLLLGLTGSIGMGKSTTAGLFKAEGVPVWDADAVVHKLYQRGGAAVAPLSKIFTTAIQDGAVDRLKLRQLLKDNPGQIKALEDIVHPLTAADRADFIAEHADAPVLLFDIPLLFEIRADLWLDAVTVVTAAPDVQRARVMARAGMDDALFQQLLQRQIPDAEKRARADYIIETTSIDAARARVQQILQQITGEADA
ncbi:dephospho-CoA kinase [Ketogulonicigenium vulgare]|uniref:dephospho-CoA kinase n=1 Tax=Ketogulonicigenium vulgare TaxID=92945 RepID=UPI0023582DAA|nr:dephospho-CoA kinase [Ketogulonicigenium vulgare]